VNSKIEQREVEYITNQLADPTGNRDNILSAMWRLYELPELSPTTRDVLNQASSEFLDEDLKNLLKKFSLSYQYSLFAANSLFTLDDVKEDIQDEDDSVLKNKLNKPDFRKIKKELENLPNASTANTAARLLVSKLKPTCKSINSNGMDILHLPLNPVSKSSTSVRYNVGHFDTLSQTINRKNKTILMMGESGSGKTTLINAMMNYLLDVQWTDPFRFKLIPDPIESNQAKSQTKLVTAYQLNYLDGINIPYGLTIVDTPGHGDTAGVERDEEITESIRQFFKDKRYGIQVR